MLQTVQTAAKGGKKLLADIVPFGDQPRVQGGYVGHRFFRAQSFIDCVCICLDLLNGQRLGVGRGHVGVPLDQLREIRGFQR